MQTMNHEISHRNTIVRSCAVFKLQQNRHQQPLSIVEWGITATFSFDFTDDLLEQIIDFRLFHGEVIVLIWSSQRLHEGMLQRITIN